MSGAQMARSIGMDAGQYHRLEHADNADPTFAAVVRIARELDVSLDWLALATGKGAGDPSKRATKAATRKALFNALELVTRLLSEDAPRRGAMRKTDVTPSPSRRQKKPLQDA